ncbi:MAG: BatD family protein, partial [Tannerella sp.]|nr:BatD family protein [Tannerella sp.]
MRQIIKLLLTLILVLAVKQSMAQDVTFRASAPESVVMGEQFRLVFTVNSEGRDLRAPDLSEFEVLMGPQTSTSWSTQ